MTFPRKFTATALGVLMLSGCSLIPDYQRPDLPTDGSWQGAGTAKEGQSLWVDTGWKQVFPDPTLQGLIQTALENNRDLRVAVLNVAVARATYQVTEANLLPEVDASAAGTTSRTAQAVSSTVPKKAVVSRQYTASLGVTSFELDFFGKLRSAEEQALESFLATDEARASAQITLIAEVANAYISLLGDHKLLALTEETLKTRETSLTLIQKSFEHGVSSELDLAQARSAVETARANLALYQRKIAQDGNALELLLGKHLDRSLLTGELDKLTLVEVLPVGLPSDVLLRRPDVAQAEHSLKAANANIGAARAAFFPSISLTGSAGFASPALNGLSKGGTGAWSFGPSLSLPIFDGGKNRANLDSAKASRDLAVAQYEKAIQTAFSEVADGLAAKQTYADQMTAQTALVTATSTSTRLSQARYDRGVDSYLTVLDSQRSLYSAQQDLVSLQVSRLTNLITLYKALGGGRG